MIVPSLGDDSAANLQTDERSDVNPRPRSIARSTLLVMLASALSVVLGFGREIVTAHYYGTRAEVDAFLNASTIPTVLFGVFNGALLAALVPIFSDYKRLGKDAEVVKMASTVINALFLATSVLAVIGWVLAPYYVPVIAHGFPEKEQWLVVQIVRWLMPGIIATSVGGVSSALLNANQRFGATAMIWVATNLVTILCVIVLHRSFGIFALVLGSVLGLFAQLMIQAPSIVKHRLYRFEFDLSHPGLSRAWGLLLPVTLGSGAAQINLAFDRYFASTLSSGSTAALNYSTRLSFLPNQIIAAAIATVIFPLLSRQFAASDFNGFQQSVMRALRMVCFVVIPSAAGLTALAFIIVQTLFQRGAFGPQATALCASLIPFACLPLLAVPLNTVLIRANYACKEVRRAATAAAAGVLVNIAMSATLLPLLGARGLLVANGIGGLTVVALQLLILRRSLRELDLRPLLLSVCKISIASLAMAGVLIWLQNVGFRTVAGEQARVLTVTALLLCGAGTFVFLSWLLKIEELRTVISGIKRKIVSLKNRV